MGEGALRPRTFQSMTENAEIRNSTAPAFPLGCLPPPPSQKCEDAAHTCEGAGAGRKGGLSQGRRAGCGNQRKTERGGGGRRASTGWLGWAPHTIRRKAHSNRHEGLQRWVGVVCPSRNPSENRDGMVGVLTADPRHNVQRRSPFSFTNAGRGDPIPRGYHRAKYISKAFSILLGLRPDPKGPGGGGPHTG